MIASLERRLKRSVEPLTATICVLAVCFVAIALVRSVGDGDLARNGVYVLAALASTGAVLAFVRARASGSAGANASAFKALYADAKAPCFLTDRDGCVVAANQALTAAAPQARLRFASDALDIAAADPKALEYRALRGIDDADGYEEVLAGSGAPRRLRVESLSDGGVLWVVEDRPTSSTGVAGAENLAPAFDAAHETPPPRLETKQASPGGGALDELPVAVMEVARDGEIVDINALATALIGDGAARGAQISTFIEGLGRPIEARIEDAFEGKDGGRTDLVRSFVSETFLQIAFRPKPEQDTLIAVISDATELKTLEQQFVQSQKMQAVGQLAGGVAHDFNNLLTAIMGHCDLMSMRRDETSPDFEDLSQIRQNANRAAAMVRQLLAFSRQQMLKPKVCQLNDVLNELTVLLNRLIGERIGLQMHCDSELWNVWIDEQQFEQVVLNLVVNARDAMPDGGSIKVECENETILTELRRDRAVVQPGDYVVIRVSDDGRGMTEEVRSKVFEPFFTTKPLGEGTGLGLSTAYGIIKQTGGFIFIDSAPGEGACFTIYLPRLTSWSRDVRDESEPEAPVDLTGAGRILLVEDEAPVRNFALRALEMRGYEVLGVATGEEALELYESGENRFDVVVSDIVMPGLDGPEWVRKALEYDPAMKVIFTSGYDEATFRRGIEGIETQGFLAKPFTLVEILTEVKAALGEPNARPEPASAE